MSAGLEALAAAILRELAAEPGTMSLPRLGKRLGQGASVLMRCLAMMGEAPIAGAPGPGWVLLQQQDGHWRVGLTERGRMQAQSLDVEQPAFPPSRFSP
jgi:FdhD protein